jgi:hypothetical protein
MMTAIRRHWDRARRLHMHVNVTQVMEDNAGAKSTITCVGTGAFAALLVEWKLAQSAQIVNDTDADQSTLKSA